MKPRRPRKGMPGFRPRKSAGRYRPSPEALQANARRLENLLTNKPGRKRKP